MKIGIRGASSLRRFSDGILKEGFLALGDEVVPHSEEAEGAILQIHGSPAAESEDKEILKELCSISARIPCILLMHRPDEIKVRHPNLSDILAGLPKSVGIAHLGTLFLQDAFYSPAISRVRAIPHGFFSHVVDPKPPPIIIGSHTTWGEMRSLGQAIALLSEIFTLADSNSFFGYLGGYPVDALTSDAIRELFSLCTKKIPPLVTLDVKDWRTQVEMCAPRTVFLCAGDVPFDFSPTFNLQMYHYEGAIRFGESSGSLHASGGIPVIFEMNGAEIIEDLRVVKVPYTDRATIESADLRSAAKSIVSLAHSPQIDSYLCHNRGARTRWSTRAVAALYRDFLCELSSSL